MRPELNELLMKLISIKSFSNGEKQVCDFVFSMLKDIGFKTEKQNVDKNGYNIIAKIGKPKTFLLAHLDTVEPFLPAKETSTHIFGRGSCDTKSCVASMITAAKECLQEGVSDIGLAFTVGEEDDFRGANRLSKLKLPFAVIGEPTNLAPVTGHYGILEIKITAHGKKAHSSMPEHSENAVVKLLDAIHALRQKLKIGRRSFMNLACLSGGAAANIIPDYAEAKISFRIHPEDKNDYTSSIKKIVKGLAEVKQGVSIQSVNSRLPKELSFLGKPKTVRYCTELSVMKSGIVLGPGDIKYAHTDSEQITKEELSEAVGVYKKIIKATAK